MCVYACLFMCVCMLMHVCVCVPTCVFPHADIALEKAMFGCVLKPLRVLLDQALLSLHRQDGSTQHLASSLLACQEGAMERLGVLVGVPDTRGVERVRQKLGLMQRTHSPIDKVLLLLQVCKSVQKAMGALHDGGESAFNLPNLKRQIK